MIFKKIFINYNKKINIKFIHVWGGWCVPPVKLVTWVVSRRGLPGKESALVCKWHFVNADGDEMLMEMMMMMMTMTMMMVMMTMTMTMTMMMMMMMMKAVQTLMLSS